MSKTGNFVLGQQEEIEGCLHSIAGELDVIEKADINVRLQYADEFQALTQRLFNLTATAAIMKEINLEAAE